MRILDRLVEKRLSLFMATGIALILASCSRLAESPAPRLVILYATCTVNKDYLSPYKPSIQYTPNLKRFADHATVFTRHHTEAGQSGISFASILTGSQADHHQVYRHPTKLPEDLLLIPEFFVANGYEAFFWSDHPMASAELDYGQGVPGSNVFEGDFLMGDDPRFQRILKRLEEDEHYKAFLLTAFSQTHGPYKKTDLGEFLARFPEEQHGLTPSDIPRLSRIYEQHLHQLQFNFPETVKRLGLTPQRIEELGAVVELIYKSRIFRLDQLFGHVVEQVRKAGLMDESVIVFTADHGEILYREEAHIKWEHGNVLLPEVLNVPLIVHAPSRLENLNRWDRVTRSVDVFPTLAGLSMLSAPEAAGIEGVDLVPGMLGEEEAPELLAYSHTTLPVEFMLEERRTWTLLSTLFPNEDERDMWTAIRDGDDFYRWRHFGGGEWAFEAYDLAADPLATRNLYDEDDPAHRAMAERLRDYKTRLIDGIERDPSVEPTVDDVEARLRSLGYVE